MAISAEGLEGKHSTTLMVLEDLFGETPNIRQDVDQQRNRRHVYTMKVRMGRLAVLLGQARGPSREYTYQDRLERWQKIRDKLAEALDLVESEILPEIDPDYGAE